MLLMNLVFKRIDSPVGLLKLVANDASLAAILWENHSSRRVRLGPPAEILATPHLSGPSGS
jgi:methylated-DNA-[protein]-cysteine S-methyltransferase